MKGLVKEVNKFELQEKFKKMNRDYFSLEGYEKLIEIFEELSECTRQLYQVDVIALCSQYCEYNTFQDFEDDYGDDTKDMVYYELSNNHVLVDSES